MKRDPLEASRDEPGAFDRQVRALALRLREEGVAPGRDLWPEISPALAATGKADRAHGGRRAAGRSYLGVGVALAACVLLAVGVGLSGLRPGPVAGPSALAPASAPTAGPVATRQGLRAVEQALHELQTALQRSPDDPDLSRLVLMIHHSRARLLRLQADTGVRNALGGRS